MNGSKMTVGLIATLALATLAGVAWFRSPDAAPATTVAASAPTTPPQAIDPRWAMRTKGSADAPVTIYELSDFQCPWCRRFADSTLPALSAEYITTGKARLIFVNFPIPSLHPNAPAAHEFAMCAADQGQFWPVHDLLFRKQPDWEKLNDPAPYFMGIADSVGVDRTRLEACIDSGSMRPLVTADLNTGRRAGMSSTPTFIIEGGVLPGAAGMDVWRPILDSILADRAGR